MFWPRSPEAGGEVLASASFDKTIALWNPRSGKVERVLEAHRLPIACVGFSPDGSLLASSAGRLRSDTPHEDEIFLWNWRTGSIVHRLHVHAGRAVCLAFAPGGKRLATAGWDNQVTIWDVDTGREVLTLVGHRDPIMALGFGKHGDLATGSLDESLRLWKTVAQK